jgi:hypothetical protein
MAAQWTVLVYLAGDNNLDEFGRHDLEELKVVGSSREVQVVAQFDRMGDGVTRRYHLSADRSLTADTVAELPEVNTGDPADLLAFIRWGLAEFPAERTALILWNHGSGWKDDDIYALARRAGLDEGALPRAEVRSVARARAGRSLFASSLQRILEQPAAIRAILFDDTSKDFLDNQEMKAVLDAVVAERGGRKLDLIGFDACLMSMVEVAHQVGHAFECMVGSQELEPGEGWPYARVLAALTAAPGSSGVELGRMIVESYIDHFAAHPPGMGVTQSALRLARLPALAAAVGRLADELAASLPDPIFYGRALLPAMRRVQKFRDRQYVDLCHLARLLAEQEQRPPVQAAAREVAALLDQQSGDSIVAAAGRIGDDVSGAHGLSIYLPFFGTVSPAYAGLEFTRNCTWGAFLRAFVESA